MQQIHQLHGAAATMLQWRDGMVKMLQQPALAAAKLCEPSGGGCLVLATMGGCYEMLAAALPCGCSKVSVVDCNIVVAILLVSLVSTMIDQNKVWKMDLEHELSIHLHSQ
ncbi:unnamed protein product [Prunus armeniaca]